MPTGVRGPQGGRNGAGGGGQRAEVGKKHSSAKLGAAKERRVVEDVVFDQPSGDGIVEEAVAGAHRSSPLLEGIPGHAEARSEVLVILARDRIPVGRIDPTNDDSV